MNIYRQLTTGTNWVDWFFAAFLAYYVFANRGFIRTSIDILRFILSLVLSYKLYPLVGKLLIVCLSFPRGIANALGFFIVWLVSELLFYLFTNILLKNSFKKIDHHPINSFLGYLVGGIEAAIIFLFFISFIFVFPVKGDIKHDILNSRTGPFFVNLSQLAERNLKQVFGEAISETINFLTVKPSSGESLNLGFRLDKVQASTDEKSEEMMFALINRERTRKRIDELTTDKYLSGVARRYAEEMLVNGFFSHSSLVDGSTVDKRAIREGIDFTVIGENLAFAPDVYLAHQGLMNSEGHRRNILLSEYRRVGIGVVDGGIYGKMFVQVFAD
jgi:uncharacterized protein YkwD